MGDDTTTGTRACTDVVPHPTIPILVLLVVSGVALIVANLAAAAPARMAQGVRPAAALRDE